MKHIYDWWVKVRPFDAEKMAKVVTGDTAIHTLTDAQLTEVYNYFYPSLTFNQ